MEVSFPLSNYTFPRRNATKTVNKNYRSSEIFIPARALKTATGGKEKLDTVR